VLKRIFLYSALFWTGVILFFCLIKSSDIPKVNIQNLDKVIHAFFHFVFVLLWFLFFKKKLNSTNPFKPLAISFVFSIVFGIIIEMLQQFFTTTRSGDPLDILANLSGATLAVIGIVLLNKFNGIVDKI
jgi:VanZ family protein